MNVPNEVNSVFLSLQVYLESCSVLATKNISLCLTKPVKKGGLETGEQLPVRFAITFSKVFWVPQLPLKQISRKLSSDRVGELPFFLSSLILKDLHWRLRFIARERG
jgi:hypothetical protein